MKKRITIAVDGPAASGKSTTARLLAQKLGYLYIDTGAMYRAATLSILNNKINAHDEQAVVKNIEDCQISIKLAEDGQHTYLNNNDVTHLIRTPQINREISVISSYAGVREILVKQQQALAVQGGVIMDGRDIGTVVLPHAKLKVFMIASLEERAKRRLKEFAAQGIKETIESLKSKIQRRDEFDASRSQAPLKKAEDARELDTSKLTIEQQVDLIYNWAKEIIYAE
jgi:cytidylate kinase